MVNVVVILFKLFFTSDRQNTKGYKVQNYINLMSLLQNETCGVYSVVDLMNLSFAGVHL